MNPITMNFGENYSGVKCYDFPERYSELESPLPFGTIYGNQNPLNYASNSGDESYSPETNIYTNPKKVNLEVRTNSEFPIEAYESQPTYSMGYASMSLLGNRIEDSDLVAALFAKIEKEEKNNFYKKRKKKEVLNSSWFFNRMTEFS